MGPSVIAETPSFLKTFPRESYHQLKSGNQVIGKTRASWKEEGTRFRFFEDSIMKLTLFKKPQRISMEMNVLVDDKMSIQEFAFKMNSAEAHIDITGQRSGTLLKLHVSQAGKTQIKEVSIQEPMLMNPLIRPYLLMKGLPKMTTTYEAILLEPSALATVPLTLQVTKKTADLWKITVSYLSQTLTSEIELNGHLLRETSNLAGLPMEASPVSKEVYHNIPLEPTKSDLVELAKVPFPKIPDSKYIKDFAVKISGIDLRIFELNRHRQKLDRDILAVQTEAVPRTGEPFPSIVGQKPLEKYLEGDTSIPVYDSVIQKKAREIVGSEPDLWKRAKLVHEFVFKTLEKIPTISVPNALEVLETKRGDCNEHAVLYTALARAAGVPTRTVVGLVYSDHFYGDPGFYYHAWVEVFTGKSWVALDPTWNQIPADATHLAFVEGGLDKQVQVTSLMGRIKLSPTSTAKTGSRTR